VAEGSARIRFRDVFAVAEYRWLWLAQILSVAGDQLARVALAVLVYTRTHSPMLTAITYAVTYVPWLIGGFALSGLADRFPRRSVMVGCDAARALLVVAMAAPGMPLWAMVALLFVITLLDVPFKSARAAMIADVLDGGRYVLGNAVTQMTIQTGTVSGFAVGGVIVGFLGVRTALVADAATFVASALMVRYGVRARPAAAATPGGSAAVPGGSAATPGGSAGTPGQHDVPEPVPQARQATARLAGMLAGVRLVFGDSRLRALMLLGWLAAFYSVAEPLAVPYTARLGGGPVAAGLVFAAGPAGAAFGSVAFTRLVEAERRLRWMGPLAVGCCLVLVACLLRPGLVVSIAIFLVSGAMGAYQLAANAAFVAAVPNRRRGQAFGLANAGMQVSQGAVYVLAGAAATATTPATVIGVAGAVGAAAACLLALNWHRQVSVQLAPLPAPSPTRTGGQ
jgi:predicted MFS family arabinose efflux permease